MHGTRSSSCSAPASSYAYQVIKDVKAKLAQIRPGLPPGVSVEPFYDRSGLIERAIDTLKHTPWEAVILVTLMHVIFLFHFRSILIVTLPLPASILIACDTRRGRHAFVARAHSHRHPGDFRLAARTAPQILRGMNCPPEF